MGTATVNMGVNSITVPAGVNGSALVGMVYMRGDSSVKIIYKGTTGLLVGGSTNADTSGFQSVNIGYDCSSAGLAITCVALHRFNDFKFEGNNVTCNNNARSTQVGILLDGTNNFTGYATFQDNKENFCNVLVRMQATNSLTVLTNRNPACTGRNSIGIDVQSAVGNIYLGGDVEGCATAFNFGGTSANNTFFIKEESNTRTYALGANTGQNTLFFMTSPTASSTDSGTQNNICAFGGGACTHITVSGFQPTSCSVTGAGTGATCGFRPQSTDSVGTMVIGATSAAPAASGTITLTFRTKMGAKNASCILQQFNIGNAWNPRISFAQTTESTASATFNWDNNDVALVAGNYWVNYHCAAY